MKNCNVEISVKKVTAIIHQFASGDCGIVTQHNGIREPVCIYISSLKNAVSIMGVYRSKCPVSTKWYDCTILTGENIIIISINTCVKDDGADRKISECIGVVLQDCSVLVNVYEPLV